MPLKMHFNKKYRQFLLITLCTFLTFCLLYFFRGYDDNRLTAWRWAFASVDLYWFFPALFAGTVIIYLLLRVQVAEKRPALFLLALSFAVTSIFWKVPEVIIDASRYFTYAKHLEVYGTRYFFTEWGRSISVWTDLPFIPFLYGLIFKYAGESRAFIQVFVSALFAMTVLITYLTGEKLWNRETGFFAGVLIMGIPYLFSQTPLMLIDVPTMFFLTLSIYSFIRAMEEGGKWTVLSALSLFCTVFAKYSTWMMLSVTGIIWVVYIMQGEAQSAKEEMHGAKGIGYRGKIVRRGVLVALFCGLMIGAVLYFKFDIIWGQIQFLREYQMPGLRRWGESFASTFLYQVHPFITIAVLYSFCRALKKKDLKFLMVSWLIILVVIFQIKRSRYVMVVFPMLALMASYGLQRIKDMELRKYIVSSAVASSLAVAIFAYLPFLQEMSTVNFQHAGNALNSAGIERVVVYTVPATESVVNPAVGVPIIDLFTDKKISYQYNEGHEIPFKEIEKSPLRFTWAYENPDYYENNNADSMLNSAIAIISNMPPGKLPNHIEEKLKGHKEAGIFKTSTGIFRYSPVVTVYLPEG
jgi:hypothetical protein